MSVHILLREIGEPFDLEVVNVSRKERADRSDYRTVAPRGMVPLLDLGGGETLTENVVIAQFLCDRAERRDLMPAPGSFSRYRVMEWQSFVASDLHKSFGPMLWPLEVASKKLVVDRIIARLGYAERDIVGPYLTGETFTAADAYFFVIASWTRHFGISLDAFPKINTLLAMVGNRASVRAALAAEGPGMVTLPESVNEQ
jgi:glutathione S-transferase